MILLLITLASCSKGGLGDRPSTIPEPDQYTVLKSTDDFQSRLQIYDLLSADEKFSLWNDHLIKARAQFVSANQIDKVSMVDELSTNMSRNIFKEGMQYSSSVDVFLNYFVPLWLRKARTVFNELEIYDLTFNPLVKVVGEREAPSEIGVGSGGTVPDCFCHVGVTGYSCRRISVGIPSGVVITNGMCEKSGDCMYFRRGCGFLWLSSCNGNHCVF